MIDKEQIFSITSDEQFNALALEVFRFQFENNPVYRSFCDLLYKHPSDINCFEDIPFLPISFFKSHKVSCHKEAPDVIFTSSSTTGQSISRHYVADINVYEASFMNSFQRFYGDIKDYTILALLPSYLEREGSSLIYMVERLIKESAHRESGFYLKNIDELYNTIIDLELQKQKTTLIGVSFALMDFIERYKLKLDNTIVMETGGMKGRRKELIREELHNLLSDGFGVVNIHSEYGMTELLSQAYSKGDGIFQCPPWMKVLTRDTEDPLRISSIGKTGALNIIDLASFNSCSFIATQDLGRLSQDGRFEVLGRFDQSDVRGCNLMVL